MMREKERDINGRIERRTRYGYVGIVLMSILYGIFVTIITAVKTPIIKSDAVEFGRTMVKSIMALYHIALKAWDFTSQLGDRIPQHDFETPVFDGQPGEKAVDVDEEKRCDN